VEDTSLGNEYQLNVAAIASSTALAGLHVTASALPAQARAGGTVSYTLTFGNPGSTAVAANLSFPLPVGTTFVSASNGGTSSAGTVTWSLGTVAAGTAGRRTVVVQVATTAVAGSQLAADAALRNPTTQVVLAHAGLTTGVGNATETVAERACGSDAGPGGPRATGAVRGDGLEHGDGIALGVADGDGAGEHDGGGERVITGGGLRRRGLYDMRGRADIAVRLQRGGRRERDGGVSGADQHQCTALERHAAQLGRVGGGYVARQ